MAWTIRLADAGTGDAGEQQSMITKDGAACPFSEECNWKHHGDSTSCLAGHMEKQAGIPHMNLTGQ